jgi:predicted Zn-dependent peptidase
MSEHVQKTVLENGVRVLSGRVEGVRSVSVGVAVNVGPKDELPPERGYAHLVEHMLFQGTDGRDARAIAEMMEVGGGAMGAFTARDYTVYHATVLDEYLPFALEVLGDMLCNSVLPQESLERQRSVILNEIAGRDDPTRLVNDLLKRALWPGHPLGFPTAGLEETIEAATRDSLLDFIGRHYVANNLVVAAAGNLDHENLVSQARDGFWQMDQDDAASSVPVPTPHLGSVVAEARDLRQVYFALAWPAPPYASPDRYTWHVFSSLFGGGPTSRLYRVLREEKGMVYHIGAQYQAYGNTGALVVEGVTQPQTLIPVLAGTLIELWRMVEDAISLDDHFRTVQSLISQHLVSGDSAYVRMSRLALQELYFDRAVPSHEVTEALRTQSPEAVQTVAQETLNAGLPTISLVGAVSEELLQAVGAMLADFGEPVDLVFTPRREPAMIIGQVSDRSSAG